MLAKLVECSPFAQETDIQSQIKSYQRLKKVVLDTSLLNTDSIRYLSRVKWRKTKEKSSALSNT